jgi:peroxiredoxin
MPSPSPDATPDSAPDEAPSRFRRAAATLWRLVRRHWMWGVLLIFGIYLWQDIRPDIDLPASGPPAPDFTLERMNGESFQLSEHRGEVVVLNVWATWCPPCRVEIPGFVDLYQRFKDQGVVFVGLSVDDSGLRAVRQYAQDHTLAYPQVASRAVAYRKYGQSTTVPRTYVIDKQGRIRYQHTGLLLKGSLEPVLKELIAEPGPSAAAD